MPTENRLTRQDLVYEVAAKVGCTKKLADAALAATLESITQALADGQSLTLVGFGTFRVTECQPRRVRNPRTGEEMVIPARRAARFSPGKSLSDSLNDAAS